MFHAVAFPIKILGMTLLLMRNGISKVFIFPFVTIRKVVAKDHQRPSLLPKNASPKEQKHDVSRQEVRKWINVFHQTEPGWIGSGFPGRALYELQVLARKGCTPAHQALLNLFESEKDSIKKAQIAAILKELTGKDFMPPEKVTALLAQGFPKVQLPMAPDDLP
jgi:hypothetical protein